LSVLLVRAIPLKVLGLQLSQRLTVLNQPAGGMILYLPLALAVTAGLLRLLRRLFLAVPHTSQGLCLQRV
jgi:hypothetical protein